VALLAEGWGQVLTWRGARARRITGRARLFAPLDAPEDLEMSLRAASEAESEVLIEVNGREVGRIRARADWTESRVRAVAGLWRRELNDVVLDAGEALCGWRRSRFAGSAGARALRTAVVIGGGPAGLKAAHALAKAGLSVTLLETAPVLGGLASSFDVQGTRIERYYHFICRGDDHLVETLAELGMSDKLRWRASRMAYFVGGALYPFLTPLDLLRFRPLSPLDRVRAGIALKLAQRMREDVLAPQLAHAWLKQLFGVEPIASSGSRSCASSSPSMRSASAPRGSGPGWSASPDRGRRRGTRSSGTSKAGARWSWRASAQTSCGGRTRRPERGCGADLARRGSRRRCPGRGRDAACRRRDLDHHAQAFSAAHCGPRRGLCGQARSNPHHRDLLSVPAPLSSVTPFFWVNANDPRVPFAGMIEYTNLNPVRELGGDRVLYVPQYLSPDDPASTSRTSR